MRSLTAEKLKITSAVQNKASKTVVSITQKSDLSTAVWRGVSLIYLYGNASPDVAGLFQLGQSCTVGNIAINQQFSCGDRENNYCYIFLCHVFLE